MARARAPQPQGLSLRRRDTVLAAALALGLTAPPVATAGPFQAGNLVVSSRGASLTPQLLELSTSGTTIQAIDIPQPVDDVTEEARGVVIDRHGRAQVFNGTFDPYLSSYDPATASWQHHTFDGWSIIANGTYGGIAVSGDFVFVPDNATFGPGDLPNGIVRFDLHDFTAVRFAGGFDPIDVAIGGDGLLYALSPSGSPGGTTLDVYDPVSMAHLRTVALTSHLGLRAIAVDASGLIFAVGISSGAYRYAPDGTQELYVPATTMFNPFVHLADIALGPGGSVAFGGTCGEVGLTNINFSPAATSLIQLNYCFETWVTFVPSAGPTPARRSTWGEVKARYR